MDEPGVHSSLILYSVFYSTIIQIRDGTTPFLYSGSGLLLVNFSKHFRPGVRMIRFIFRICDLRSASQKPIVFVTTKSLLQQSLSYNS